MYELMAVTGTNQRKSRKLPVLIGPQEREVRAWIQIMRTYTRIERRLEQMLEWHGVSLPQFDVLATLRAGEGITQQELAERLLVTKGNVCALLGRMEVGGWVERRTDPEDRRANRLYLTRRGKDVLTAAMPEHHKFLKSVMSALRPVEVQSLYELLERVEEGVGSGPLSSVAGGEG
ncbi:MAG: transcriptional regulator [Phycisphaerales bacterium]|jgi:DNA-binding MarR family transcriptional regulator|nr:transcriptional regulator [Phycisphaerales bacterium]